MSGDLYERLARRFENHKTVNKGGVDQTYVPAADVIERLNQELGLTGWSFVVVREGFTATEAWVLGELTATIDGVQVRRQQYGNESITMGRSEKATGDLLKKAGTDSLKKCATLIGVAAYLYDEDERREVQAEMREQARNGGKPAPKPQPEQKPALQEPTPIQKARAAAELTGAPPQDGKRAEIVANCQKVMRLALAEGLDFEQRDPHKMTDQDIQDYGKALADMIRAARQAAS